MIVQAVFDFSFDPPRVIIGRGVDWAVPDVAQLRQWLEEGRKPREMPAMRSDWPLESTKMKIKQLRRGAPEQSRPLKQRRTSEVLAETETAVNETPRQTLSVLRRRGSLDMSRSTPTRRSPRAVLRARPCADIDG